MEPRRVLVATLVVLGTLLGAFLVYQLRGLILLVYGALILAAAIKPLVARLERWRVPRPLAVLLIYLAVVLIVTAVLMFVIPPVVAETDGLIRRWPEYEQRLQQVLGEIGAPLGISVPVIHVPTLAQEINQRLPGIATGVLQVTVSALTGIFGLLFLLVIAFYWTLEREDILDFLLGFAPPEQRQNLLATWEEIEDKMGAYVRGQLVLGVIVGALSYGGLKLLGVHFTLVLAIIAGFTELIPNIGPVIGAVPAVVIAFTESPLKALLVIGLYTLIQQAENHILVPKIMQAAVGVSPLTVLLSILAGGVLLGVVGAVLAVPTAAIVKVILDRMLMRRKASSVLSSEY